jgi:hypothetical protein
MRFPDDREAAANYVHQAWIERNRGDKSQPKELFKPYARLSEVEKDKDRAHVDRMKRAIAAVRKQAKKKAPGKKTKRAASLKMVRLDARTWARIERASRELSKAVGREITPEALLVAGAEALAAVARKS